MAEYFAGGHLRFLYGEWRDDDGDVIEISKVRHGRWILRNKWEPFGFKYECSICHDGSDLESKYCPHCGTNMDLGRGRMCRFEERSSD